MLRKVIQAFLLLVVMTLLTGVAYPLAVTGLGQLIFPRQANGSLVRVNGRVVGSALIGQQFHGAQYFRPRPSAAGEGYDPRASGGSNLGPTSRRLKQEVGARLANVRKENGLTQASRVPSDLVTASASGLDPDVTPEAARLQIPRVARARGLSEDVVRRLVARYERRPLWGILGEPRVNVLELNLALDGLTRGR
ncbi:MAG: potassium-transporting ATPase subunit KdpC [Chitinophagales bacterium]